MHVMTRIEATGSITLAVHGSLDTITISDFDRALARALRLHQPVVIDLSDVKSIDRGTRKHLADLMNVDALTICPEYIEHWIVRESGREPLE